MSEDNRNQNVFGQGYSMPAVKVDDEIPDDKAPLPSKGLIYGPEHPLHKKDSIDFKVMTAKQEDILTNRALMKKGTTITELLKSCLIDKSIKPDDMLTGDRNTMMVMLRVTGYGSDYPIEVECGECGHKHEYVFSLSKLPIKTLEINPVSPFENKFEFTLPISKQKVYFKFLTGKDEEDLSNTIDSTTKKLGELSVRNVTTKLLFHIIQVGDKVNRGDIASFINTMRAGDSKALRAYIEEHTPRIEMEQNCVCPQCGDERSVGVPITSEFFWPK